MDLTKKEWSYSSLKLYETCRYAFYLKYVEDEQEGDNAFALHGKLSHSILERWAKGELYAFELADTFEQEYDMWVTEKFPFYNMYKAFFDKTLAYFENFDGIDGEIIGVEQELKAVIGGHKFIGFADLIVRDENGIVLIDHKSHGAWKSKKERADYMRQLYLYAYCIKEVYGEFPYKLVFNKFRCDEPWDEELFKEGDYTAAIDWFKAAVDTILATTEWECKVDKFYCESLCRLNCVYSGVDDDDR